ncbi:autotransporter outer membrane beta-barrel domain-containing protein [Martelella mediterranea]|uniref:autotransporter outer membrane beta-barrel domain-containing protein n=1 Tax=Martelella mediterranea TaxID=293089 RepID=UPI001E5587B5|nr:autotransporter outer membrane beta-barrel domain-containing protein [Martelella mediterranea]MCD1634181.1 autotransporter outer membrane beta-barrel domain-containing protein [Martelella mediterranea]
MQPLIGNFSGRAIAADECGAPAGTNDTITCNNTTYTTGPGDDIAYTGVDGLTLIIDDGGTGTLDVTTAGAAVSVTNDPTSTNPVAIQAISFGTISTTGNSQYAISATSQLGATSVSVSSGQVSTTGDSAYAVNAQSGSFGTVVTATVNVSGNADISATGFGAHAVYAGVVGGQAGSVATIEMRGGTVSTAGATANGLFANGGTGSVDTLVDLSGGSVTTLANNATAVRSRSGGFAGDATVIVRGDATISTEGANSGGIDAYVTNSSGNVTADFSGTSITTQGSSAHGIEAHSLGGGAVDVFMRQGVIQTEGALAQGIYAYNVAGSSTADVTVDVSGGSITTLGSGNAVESRVVSGASTGNAVITMSAGTVEARGGGYGLHSFIGGQGDALTTVSGGSVVTEGDTAHAIYNHIFDLAATGEATVRVNGGSISASGNNAHGILNYTRGTGDANVYMTAGSVSASGADAHGINTETIYGGYAVEVLGGTVTAGSGTGAAIYAFGPLGGTADIGSAAVIDGSASGIALVDADTDSEGFGLTSGGNITVTSAGMVTGDGILNLGDDSLTISGGSWTGNIYGDGMTADAADGADTFTWSAGAFAGGYYAGGGNDTAAISSSGYDGSQIFSGDDAAGTLAATTYDTITFSGVNATTDAGATIVYWDEVTLENTTLSVTSAAWDISTAPGQGLFLNNSTLAWTAQTGNLNANLDIGAGSTASFGGTSLSVAGNLVNNGLLTMQDGSPRSNVVVLGNYAGTGTLAVDVNFANDTADVLTVNGDVTGGPTLLSINNATSGYATGNDVLVVDVAGTSAAGDFALSGGPIGSGAYLYDLFFATGDFYLGTDGTYQPAVPVYEAYPQMLMALGRLPTLRQRIGERDVYDGKAGRVTDQGADLDAVWGRIDATHDHFEPKSAATSYETDFAHWALNIGVDGLFSNGENGQLIGGVYAKYLNGFADTTSAFGNGKTSVDGYGLGATLTWYEDNGFYADGQAQFQWYDSDLKGDTLGTLADGNQGSGFSTSIEIGKSFALSDRASLTPQAQLTYAMISFDDFNSAAYGENVSLGNNDSLRLRLGLSTDEMVTWQDDAGKMRSAGIYTIANVHYEFLEGTSVEISGVSLHSDLQGLYGEAGIGGTYSWADGKYAAYGEISGLAGFGDTQGNYSIAGKAGLMVRW